MKNVAFCALSAALLAGCGATRDGFLGDGLFGSRTPPEPVEAAPEPTEPTAVPEDARTAEEFDTTSADDREAALQAAQAGTAETDLGLTIASLGDVTAPGIWLKTPLVSEASKGRVTFAEKGTAVAVDLIPINAEGGAGSRISLAAMRLLEADLTSLPE